MVGAIISIALHICMKRGMIFWKYKLFLLTRYSGWRNYLKTYGSEDLDYWAYRVGNEKPYLKPLGLCMICTAFWIGLPFGVIDAFISMTVMYVFIKVEKKYL